MTNVTIQFFEYILSFKYSGNKFLWSITSLVVTESEINKFKLPTIESEKII